MSYKIRTMTFDTICSGSTYTVRLFLLLFVLFLLLLLLLFQSSFVLLLFSFVSALSLCLAAAASDLAADLAPDSSLILVQNFAADLAPPAADAGSYLAPAPASQGGDR